MGMITVLVIKHDYFHTIEEDPQGFGEAIVNAIRNNDGVHNPDSHDRYHFKVMPCVHTGDSHLYLVSGGTITAVQSEMLEPKSKHWAAQHLRDVFASFRFKLEKIK